MPANTRTRTAVILSACLLACAAGARAQEMDEQDYRKMLDQAMKSGNYSQNQAESWDARLKVVSGTVMVKAVEKDEWSRVSGEIPLDPSERRIGMRHLACPDAAAPFRAWAGKRDRIPY